MVYQHVIVATISGIQAGQLLTSSIAAHSRPARPQLTRLYQHLSGELLRRGWAAKLPCEYLIHANSGLVKTTLRFEDIHVLEGLLISRVCYQELMGLMEFELTTKG